MLTCNHDTGILAFIWYKYELCISVQNARKTHRKRAVSGQFGAFFMSELLFIIYASRGDAIDIALHLQLMRNRYCNLGHRHL